MTQDATKDISNDMEKNYALYPNQAHCPQSRKNNLHKYFALTAQQSDWHG